MKGTGKHTHSSWFKNAHSAPYCNVCLYVAAGTKSLDPYGSARTPKFHNIHLQ